jgi:hypothetical protein
MIKKCKEFGLPPVQFLDLAPFVKCVLVDGETSSTHRLKHSSHYRLVFVMDNNSSKRKRRIKSQDEKEKRSKETEKKKQKNDFTGFLTRAKRDVDFWRSAFCEDLRDFYRYALSHSEQFPMAPNDSPLVDAQDRRVDSMPPLSEGFIAQI